MQIGPPSGAPPVVHLRGPTEAGPARVTGVRPVEGSGAEVGDEASRRGFARRAESAAEAVHSTSATALFTVIDYPRDYLDAGSARRAGARPIEGIGAAGGDEEAVRGGTARRAGTAVGTARAMPATVLHAMFEQMGGAATSVWKGMHVNLVV